MAGILLLLSGQVHLVLLHPVLLPWALGHKRSRVGLSSEAGLVY